MPANGRFPTTFHIINVNENELYTQLLYMSITDYFFGNGDRQWENIDFLITETGGKKYLALTPNFDYEYFFNMYSYETFLKIKNSVGFADKTIKEFKNDKFYQRVLLGISDKTSKNYAKKEEIITEYKNYRSKIPKQAKSYFDEYSYDNSKLIVLDILEISQKDKRIKEFVNSIKMINILEIFNEIEFENNLQIPDMMKEIVIDVFTDRKNLYNSLNDFVEDKRNNKERIIEY